MIEQEWDNRKKIYIPICDICGAELRAEYSFMDAVNAKKNSGWRSAKDAEGNWIDKCEDCQRMKR